MKKMTDYVIGVLVILMNIHAVHAANTHITIQTNTSTYSHLYYEVIENKKRITEDVIYTIHNQSEIIIKNKTKDGILQESNLPFGPYTITIQDKEFPIIIDEDYLLTQHILKPLNLSSSIQTSTTDNNKILPFIYLCISSLFTLIYIKRKSPLTG